MHGVPRTSDFLSNILPTRGATQTGGASLNDREAPWRRDGVFMLSCIENLVRNCFTKGLGRKWFYFIPYGSAYTGFTH